MIKFIPSTKEDVDQIREWAAADTWHQDQKQPEWWLTGSGHIAFCAQDEIGPVVYVKVEKEGDWYRLHCQFGPREEVSRERLLGAMVVGLPVLFGGLKNGKGVIFNSMNPSLIKFMVSLGFKSRVCPVGDYELRFEVI
jgi:hypothetical protein